LSLRSQFFQRRRHFSSQAKLSVIDYLAFYHGRRPHSKLGYQIPLEFERDYFSKAA